MAGGWEDYVPPGPGRWRTTRWPTPQPAATWEERLHAQLDKLWEAWADFLGRLPWRHMVTLTFDPKRVFPVGQERASKEAWMWFDRLSWIARRQKSTWVYCTDRGRSGLWHIHGLVLGRTEEDLELAIQIWWSRNGSATFSSVTGPRSASLYVTKDTSSYAEVVLAPNLLDFKDQLRGHDVVELMDAPCPVQ